MARKLILEDAKIQFRNFSGNKFGVGGPKDVSFKIAPDDAEQLRDQDWPIRFYTPKDDDGEPLDDPTPYLKAKIKYETDWPPKIYMVTSNNTTLLDESTINQLDDAVISYIDCIIGLSSKPWELNGKTGYTAYVNEMYVTIEESNFARKYGVYDK